jgi:hypothetical protein
MRPSAVSQAVRLSMVTLSMRPRRTLESVGWSVWQRFLREVASLHGFADSGDKHAFRGKHRCFGRRKADVLNTFPLLL